MPAAGLAAASATFVFHTVNLVMQSIVADTLIDLEKRLEVGDSQSGTGKSPRLAGG